MKKQLLSVLLSLIPCAAIAATSWIMNPHTGKLDATSTSNVAGPRGYDGFDGVDGDTYTCTIMLGPRTITYDENGLLPQPNTISDHFAAYLYKNNGVPESSLIRWYTNDPGATHISGSFGGTVTGTMFHPTIQSSYSSAKNDNAVYATFSTAKMKCVAYAEVSVTKIGATGAQGPPGDLSSLTRADVTNVLDNASDSAVTLQPATNSGTVSMSEVRDYTGNVRNYIDSSGYQYFKDANGYTVTKIMTDGTVILFDRNGFERVKLDNLGRITIKDAANKRRIFMNHSSLIRTYRSNGTTVAFEVYSSGRINQSTGGGSGTPGGTSQQVQWNNGGAFAGFGRYSANAEALIIKQLVIQ